MLFEKVLYFSTRFPFAPLTTQTRSSSQGKSITKKRLGQVIACLSVQLDFSAGSLSLTFESLSSDNTKTFEPQHKSTLLWSTKTETPHLNVTRGRFPGVKSSVRISLSRYSPIAATLATSYLPVKRSLTSSKWGGTRRGKTARQTRQSSVPLSLS